jgi:hypothetical protein
MDRSWQERFDDVNVAVECGVLFGQTTKFELSVDFSMLVTVGNVVVLFHDRFITSRRR